MQNRYGVMMAALLAGTGATVWAEVPIPAPGAGAPMMTQMLNDPDALPAVNTCIAAHPGAFGTAWVEDIMPAANGRALVTTNDLDGRKRECTAELKTGRLIKSTMLGDVPQRVYVPRTTVRPTTPSGPCFTAYPVVVNRQLHGWRLERELSTRCATPDWLAPLNRPKVPPPVLQPQLPGNGMVSGSVPGPGIPGLPATGAVSGTAAGGVPAEPGSGGETAGSEL